MPAATVTVTVDHDEAADVWYVRATDLPGLHVEAPTFAELLAVIKDVASDLMAEPARDR